MVKNFPTVLLLILMINVNGLAQEKQEKAVANAVEKLKQALISGDKAVLESIADEKLSYGHSSGAIDDKKIFVEKLTNGSSDFVSIELSDQTIAVSGKTAIVRHKLFAKTNDNNKPGEVRLHVMLVFHKKDKDWKLLARQAVRIN